MPYTGATFNPVTNGDYPAVENTVIDPDDFNEIIEDIATALTGVITRDGSGSISGNLNMGSHKLTSLSAGSSNGDSVRYEQVQLASAVATALEGLSWVADQMVVATGAAAFALVPTTAAGRGFLNFTDPNVDAIRFWDDSAGAFADLTLGTGLSISATTLSLHSALTDLIAVPLSQTVLGRLATITAFGASLIDDANLGTALTTLGVTSFVQTLLDDTTAGAFLTTLGVSANAQTILGHTFAQMRADLDLEAGTDFYSISAADTLLAAKATLAASNTFTAGPQILNNNIALQGKTAGGTGRNLAKVDGSDITQLGDINIVTTISGFDINLSPASNSRSVAVTTGDFQITAAPATLATNSAGFRGMPIEGGTGITDHHTLTLANAGGCIIMVANSKNVTIPPNSSVAFPTGTAIHVICYPGQTGLSIVEGSGVTLNRADGVSGTGTRGVTNGAGVTLIKQNTNNWLIEGLISS